MTISNGRTITVTQPSSSYALVDLATVKNELGITSTANDTSLSRAIRSVSSTISNYCNPPQAPFVVEARSDLFQFPRDPSGGFKFNGDDRIVLSRYPVLKISSVTQTLADGTTQALVAGTDYLPDLAKGIVMRLDSQGRLTRWEALPLTIAYVAGYGTLISAESHVIPATPFAVTPAALSATATFAINQGVTFANGTPLVSAGAATTTGQYTVGATGTYTFAPADTGKAINLNYAVNQIPDDLVGFCLELISARWLSRGRDPQLIQRETPGIGTERFWYGIEPGHTGPFPPRIQAALDNTYGSQRVA
jgi:hypothetical protein